MKTVLQLIKEQCANFDNEINGIKNHCCICEHLDYQCKYFSDNKFRCPYFEGSVLPIDKQLEAVYFAEYEAKQNGKELDLKTKKEIAKANKTTRTCEICKKEFISKGKQKICKKCKKKI